MDVENINGRALFRADLRGGNVQLQRGERFRDGVEQADAILGFNFDDGAGFGRLVVEMKDRGDPFAGIALVERAGVLMPGDEGLEVEVLAGQHLVQHLPEFFALAAVGQVARAGVRHKKRVQRDAVGARENLRAENVQARRAERAGDLAEQAGAVPGADFDGVAAAVRFVAPVQLRCEQVVIVGDLVPHEGMGQVEILENFRRGMNLEIARQQPVEMRLDFVAAEPAVREPAHLLEQKFALFFLGADEFHPAGQQRPGLAMQRPKQVILETVPELVAGRERVGEGEQREQEQSFRRLHLLGEVADDERVIQVASLGKTRHEQMVFDHDPQRVRGHAVELQPPGHAVGELAAEFRVLAVAGGLAGVVQQHCEVEQERMFELLEQRRVGFVAWLLGFPDAVHLFEADQRVLVGGVLMIKLVLHQAGQPAELGEVFAQQADLVHRAQDRGDVAALVEDFQERFAHMRVVLKLAVGQGKLVADQLREVGMQPQAALLRMEEHTHQAARLVAEDAVRDGVDFTIDEFETVHRLGRGLSARLGQEGFEQ